MQIALFHQKCKVNKLLSKYDTKQSAPPRVLAVITHIVTIEKAKDTQSALTATDKLKKVIDGILDTFSHCDFKIIVNTMKDRHVIAYLPDYQRNLIHIKEQLDCNPMFVEFRAQDIFIQHHDDFEWFLFLEDDIILRDSCILDKLSFFRRNLPDVRILLRPNLYEMHNGVKKYINIKKPRSQKEYLYNRWSVLKIGDWEFVRFLNPHLGFYCLSKDQLKLWIDSGRKWRDADVSYYVGSLEAAATGCLHECFLLYQPHVSNLYFLEVEHCGPSKYVLDEF